MKTISIILIGILILAFLWSIWFFVNYPQTYLAGDKVQKRCDEQTNKTPYCVGYSAGYDWGFQRYQLGN